MAHDDETSDWCADCRADLLRFVNGGILWGEAELEGWDGPDAWQGEPSRRSAKKFVNETLTASMRSTRSAWRRRVGHGIG